MDVGIVISAVKCLLKSPVQLLLRPGFVFEVAREFYERDAGGLPRAWLARVKASLATNGPAFSATRMVQDYVRQFYTRP